MLWGRILTACSRSGLYRRLRFEDRGLRIEDAISRGQSSILKPRSSIFDFLPRRGPVSALIGVPHATEGRAEIAARLSISPRTAEMHRAKAMRKLGLKTQAELVRYALRRGMIPPVS